MCAFVYHLISNYPQCQRDYSLLFLSRRFGVISFTFRTTEHLELIFAYTVKGVGGDEVGDFFLSFLNVDIQQNQYYLLKHHHFLHCNVM